MVIKSDSTLANSVCLSVFSVDLNLLIHLKLGALGLLTQLTGLFGGSARKRIQDIFLDKFYYKYLAKHDNTTVHGWLFKSRVEL